MFSIKIAHKGYDLLIAFYCSLYKKNCGRGESLCITTCLKIVVGVIKDMLPVKYFCYTEPLSVSEKFNADHKTAYKDESKYGHPHFSGYYWI